MSAAEDDLGLAEYLALEILIDLIDEPNRTGCQRILKDNRPLFQVTPGSTNNHQNWPGGYIDHVTEIMNIAVQIYYALNKARPLPFSLSDLLLVLFFHDIEKPWKYDLGADGQLHHKPNMQTKADHQAFRLQKLAEYGIVLTPEHENGLKYAEGEIGDEYSSRERRMHPLAAMAHMCDVWSARGWFNHPLELDDPWWGARRARVKV